MKTATLKAALIIFIGLITWTIICYLAIAFLKAETNFILWAESTRLALLFLDVCFLCFVPLFFTVLKDELNP